MVLAVCGVRVGIEKSGSDLKHRRDVVGCLPTPFRSGWRSEEGNVITSQRIRVRIESVIYVVGEYRQSGEGIRRSDAASNESQLLVQQCLLQVHLPEVVVGGVERVYRE